MKKIVNWVLGKKGEDSPNNGRNMSDVMRRVDQQIGRAVERLSDR